MTQHSTRTSAPGAVHGSTPSGARIAAAPISWGVCEVPDWGYQLDAATVLDQMRGLGLAATEFGPEGFLETEPAARAEQLASYGLRAVGGFLPVLLHDPDHDPLPEVDRFIDGCVACGAGVVVLAAYTGVDGYDARPDLDAVGWATLLGNLDRISDHARSRGVVAALHPHVGTMVESGEETERVLSGSRVGLCVDTGHLLVGGGDPVAITAAHPERVEHVHLKDVDAAVAERYGAGGLTLMGATQEGLFQPLGRGDARIAEVLAQLEAHGYERWLVLEQDAALTGEEPPVGSGPVLDVQASIEFVRERAPGRGRGA